MSTAVAGSHFLWTCSAKAINRLQMRTAYGIFEYVCRGRAKKTDKRPNEQRLGTHSRVGCMQYMARGPVIQVVGQILTSDS